MKKLLALTLAMVMVFSFAGCNLFNNTALVKFDDTHTLTDPEGLVYDERITLKNEAFGDLLEATVNQAANPDTMVYDENGNMIGMYDYDATTGKAVGMTNLTDGSYTAFEPGKEVDLGLPDATKMIDLAGTVTMGIVVYGNKELANAAYYYLFLSDAADKEVVKSNGEMFFNLKLTEESDTVLVAEQDAAAIADELAAMETEEMPLERKDAGTYADILKSYYGVKEFGKVNPYKPYEGHEDPTDFEFDEKTILTCSGEWAVTEENVDKIASMTDYIYGKDGKVVARYTYYECVSKEAADTLFAEGGELSYDTERVSDTVILQKLSGQAMADHVATYMGYSVLKDDGFDTYVTMWQETYFSMIYE